MLEGEQEQQSDQQREDAKRLGHREAENQVAELTLRGGGVAQRRREIVPKDGADAHAGTAHTDAGYASADHFCGLRIHERTPFPGLTRGVLVARVDRIVEIDASENCE